MQSENGTRRFKNFLSNPLCSCLRCATKYRVLGMNGQICPIANRPIPRPRAAAAVPRCRLPTTRSGCNRPAQARDRARCRAPAASRRQVGPRSRFWCARPRMATSGASASGTGSGDPPSHNGARADGRTLPRSRALPLPSAKRRPCVWTSHPRELRQEIREESKKEVNCCEIESDPLWRSHTCLAGHAGASRMLLLLLLLVPLPLHYDCDITRDRRRRIGLNGSPI